MTDKERKRRGPKPERVKVDIPWEDAVKKALKREKPPQGWPDKDKDSDSEKSP